MLEAPCLRTPDSQSDSVNGQVPIAMGAKVWDESYDPSSSEKPEGEIERFSTRSHFVSCNPAMLHIRRQIEKIADFDIPVLVLGESGTGKEVIARLIHSLSSSARQPFLKVNCAALPDTLLESELFGYERGAFTGAFQSKPGKFQICNRGTILLDEIAELSPALQAKLLQVLQDKCFSPLGSFKSVTVDVRILAATNVKIGDAIKSQKLREDLYYRLNTLTIQVPPLRTRRDEIPILLDHFIARFASEYGHPVVSLSSKLLNACINYRWPGNVRELESFVRRFLIQRDETQALYDLQANASPNVTPEPPRKANVTHAPIDLKFLARDAKSKAEREIIARALVQTHYKRQAAARLLKVSKKSLYSKIKKYGLDEVELPAC